MLLLCSLLALPVGELRAANEHAGMVIIPLFHFNHLPLWAVYEDGRSGAKVWASNYLTFLNFLIETEK